MPMARILLRSGYITPTFEIIVLHDFSRRSSGLMDRASGYRIALSHAVNFATSTSFQFLDEYTHYMLRAVNRILHGR